MLLTPLELQLRAQTIKTLRPHLLNSVIRSAAHSSNPVLALGLFNYLLRRSRGDRFTFTFSVKSCCSLLLRGSSDAAAKGREIHARALKSGYGGDIFVQYSLLSFYAAIGAVGSLSSVFSDIGRPDVVSWTAFVSGLAKNGKEMEAVAVFSRMEVKPNSLTLVALLSACSRLGSLERGKAVNGYRLRFSLGDRNLIPDNAILDMYMRCGKTNAARSVFDGMPVRDIVSWTTVISGFNWNQRPEEAISAFQTMAQRGVVPNEATFVSALGACASMAALSSGKGVHLYMDLAGFPVEGLAGNALLNMYAKCGDLANALQVFDEIPDKDSTAWNTILGCMALSGRSKRAIEFFSLMIRHGVRPDGVSFLALISACCHSGLLNQGFLFLGAMERAYGIIPEQKHYGCIADMLARAGMLEESEAFAAEIMPAGIDNSVRGALLSACKIHGLEAKSFERLMCREESAIGGGIYALLSSAYSCTGHWNLAENTRDEIRRRGLKKTTGFSWVVISPSSKGFNGIKKKTLSEKGEIRWG